MMMMMIKLFFLLLSFSLLADKKEPPAKPQAPKKEEDITPLVIGVQKKYDAINTSSLDFEQNYKHPFLSLNEVSKGKISYEKNGGKIVWNYLQPSNKQKKFYINGNKFVYYSVSDKLAYAHDCYQQDTLSASVSFLMGKGDLIKSFNIKKASDISLSKDLSWIELTPKDSSTPVKQLIMGIDKQHNVKETIVIDPSNGKNHFKFSNLKANIKFSPTEFIFTAPKGVKVSPMPNVTCPNKEAPKTVIVKPQNKNG